MATGGAEGAVEMTGSITWLLAGAALFVGGLLALFNPVAATGSVAQIG